MQHSLQVHMIELAESAALTNRKLFVLDLLIDVRRLHAYHWEQFVPKHHDANDAELHNHKDLC